VKIERLILQGFKSFGERASLEFNSGICGIVGPNGSGKSNLVEALRWVVGARARELRGEEAQSLLFHGADGKAPIGFAEVILEISRNRERLSVSRRLEREGDAEVRLNNSRSTVRQVEQALMGTGLSRSGYAIVGQGEVGQILQAGPEVLLTYLEEAAGLRAVTQASKAAHERLEAATHELHTRNLEMEERKATIASKALQAEAAHRATALAAKALILRRSLIQARIREADQEAKAAREKAGILEQERRQISERLTWLEKEKQQALEAQEKAQTAHSEALRQAEALAGELKLVEQERQSVEGLLQRLSRDIAEFDNRIARVRSVPQPAQPQTPEAGDAAEGEPRLKLLSEEILAEEQQLRSSQQAFERYLQAQAAYEVQKIGYRQAQAQGLALQADQQRLEEELAQVSQTLQRGEARQQELQARLNDLLGQEGQLVAEARAARAEAGRLEVMLRSGSDLAEGPRKARESGIAGILGIVADLIQVPADLDLAIEVALGGRLQWVISETEQAAQAAIKYLKQQGGRATFLPRTRLKRWGGSRDWSKEPGVLGIARDMVSLAASPEVLPTLLGDTLVIQTLEAALALTRRFSDYPRIVTLQGELLEKNGAITGGRVQGGGQMLSLRRRFSETQQEANRLEADVEGLRQPSQAIRSELQALNLEVLSRKATELASELKATQANLGRYTSLAEPQAPQRVQAPDPLRVEILRAEREALNIKLSQQRELQTLWQHYREDSVRYHEAQSQLSELETRLLSLRAEQAELSQKLSTLQAQKTLFEQQRLSLNLRELEAVVYGARGRNRALAEEETQLLARTNQVLSDLESLHLTQARREAIVETLQVEMMEVPDGPLQEGSSRSLARALSETEAELQTLGPVNHLAEQEYALLSEDIAKLETALAESQEAAQKLQSELHTIQASYRERMDGVYQVFKEKFAYYAEVLLGAEVKLERIHNGLDLVLKPAGKRTVHLNLLSMGERTMGALAFLFALSEVGEGAVGTAGGLPIAILDEVDAPLDEANIQRFCQFLRRFSDQTQFILVTHQKRTMEACDALYGVTTNKGVSKVYSIKREDVVA